MHYDKIDHIRGIHRQTEQTKSIFMTFCSKSYILSSSHINYLKS